jgi:hypothetical protein
MYVLIAVAWIAMRLSVFSHAEIIVFPDSASYLTKAAEPLWTRDYFFGSGRFFVVPLFYKIALAVHGPARTTLTHAQLMLSLCAWMVLAWSLAAQFGRIWLGVISFAATLALGLSSDVIQWDTAILSESVSTSLFAVLMATWVRLSNGPTAGKVASVILVAAAWSMSREANSLLVAPLAVGVVLWALWYVGRRRGQIRCAILASTLIAITVASVVISGSGDRWVFPLLNVIGQRVLPSPEETTFFRDHGMPVNARLMDMAGEYASGKNMAFYSAPELANFRAWLSTDGRKVYGEYLLTHPIKTLKEPLQDVSVFICPDFKQYMSGGFQPLYRMHDNLWFCQPNRAQNIVVGSLLLGIVLIGGAYVLRCQLQESDGFRVLSLAALLVGWVPFTWFAWHVIGQMEVDRHVWSGVMMFRIAILLLLVYLAQIAERVFGPKRLSRQSANAPQGSSATTEDGSPT